MRTFKNALIILLLAVVLKLSAQENLPYQLPPEEIKNLVLAPSTPRIMLDGSGSKMLLLDLPELPPIAELAAKEVKVAGIRINPDNNGPSRSSSYTGIRLSKSLTGKDIEIKGMPENPQINHISWNKDNSKFAFTNSTDNSIELWVVDVGAEKAEKVTQRAVNAILYSPFQWLNEKNILFKAVPEKRGNIPEENKLPSGPVIQENLGTKAPSRTYQDLIKNPYDESLFEYFGKSDLVKLDLENSKETIIYNSALINSFSPSPGGNFILVNTIQTPYSYLVPFYRFPMKFEVIDLSGNLVQVIEELPLAENVPVAFNSVRTGRRTIGWRNDVPETLYFVEALDEGDAKKEVEFRDRISTLDPPFNGAPKELFNTTLRYSSITWGDAHNAIATERWWATRKEITRFIDPTERTSVILNERSSEDRYNDPGYPVTKRNEFGKPVLLLENGAVFLFGSGASPEGDKPFVDRFNLTSKKTERLWRSSGTQYENPVAMIDPKFPVILCSRESATENPNYFLRNLKNRKLTQITHFPHPYAALKDVKKQVLHYKRDDGVDLTLDLYLPAGYNKEQGPLPGILWAYPREFKSSDAAGQVKGSPYQFTRLYWGSPIYWVTQGYAVLDNTSIPIVGEGDAQPNDSFIEQLIAGAKAAIDKCAEMGVLDPHRVAVGGHSYGAFMTANLLAHSELFAAGIARSGAYNRTFTPFGFQAEERTYWEAPDVYNRMSPFMNANKIKKPLLLIHGDADNNPGTFTIQSERLFNAIKGHGGIARFVNLPFESHGYKAQESILHTLWEQHQWLEKFVKRAEVPLAEIGE